MKSYPPHRSSAGGIAPNLLAMGAYLAVLLFNRLGFALVLVLFLIEKKSGLVKRSALQAGLLWGLYQIVSIPLAFGVGYANAGWFWPLGLFSGSHWGGSFLLGLLKAVLGVVFLACCIPGAVYGYRWQEFRFPFIANLADKILAGAAPAAYNGDGPPPPGCEPTGHAAYSGNQPPPYPPRANPAIPPSPPDTPAAPGSPHGSAPGGAPPPPPATPSTTFPVDAGTAAPHNPNNQLPPEMRDPPPPEWD